MPKETRIQNEEVRFLEQEIFGLEQEKNRIETTINAFQNELRQRFIEEIIEEQELSNLYREKQKAKKAKRQAQKKKGKNYKQQAPGLKIKRNKTEKEGELISFDSDNKVKLKKLYRECMLLVHPDNFSMKEDDQEAVANMLTTQLIDIYKTGNLNALQNFKAHILAENTTVVAAKEEIAKNQKYAHLKSQIEELQKQILVLKNHQLYKVLNSYPGKNAYIKELEDYFKDRLFKLKKRLRMK